MLSEVSRTVTVKKSVVTVRLLPKRLGEEAPHGRPRLWPVAIPPAMR
jgi:hypothetical protein